MSIVATRERLTAAMIAEAQNLPEHTQAALAAALAQSSPVDCVVAAFEALRVVEDPLETQTLSALRACAEDILAHNFHGLADAAETLLTLMAD